MKITIFGLAITSSWGNGHATTYRALCNALAARGHQIIFFEQDAEWYANNRDIDGLPDVTVVRYRQWQDVLARVRSELRTSDVAMIGSYFPQAAAAMREVFASGAVKTFYDIDTPITLSQLRATGRTAYLRAEDVQHFDVYFSFTGGPTLREFERDFAAKRTVALYCSVETGTYRDLGVHPDFACDMSYMGTYAPDRQPKLEKLLCDTARTLPDRRFIVAGPQYPLSLSWPANVVRIEHLEPKYHPLLYSSSKLVLNVTRRDMVMAGYSPSVRLFEAAACGAAIVSDVWPGLDEFFMLGEEILVASSTADALNHLRLPESELRRIGRNAQRRILEAHSSRHRAQHFEQVIADVAGVRTQVSAIGG